MTCPLATVPVRQAPTVRTVWWALLALHLLPVLGAFCCGWRGFGVGIAIVIVTMLAAMALPHGGIGGRARRGLGRRDRVLCLSIDDGPCEDTAAILGLLDRYGVRAVFFVIGARVENDPQALRDIVAAGHMVGNHSMHHPAGRFWSFPPPALRREIAACQKTIIAACGQRPQWFRAPVGLLNPFMRAVAAEYGMDVLGWNARGFDTWPRAPEAIAAAILHDLRPGGVVLLHQGHAHSLRVLELVLARATADGWRFAD